MPVHDWTRVSAGTFHDFHSAWIIGIRNALNGGVLPDDFYAQAEQVAGQIGPDVLTLKWERGEDDAPVRGGVALATAPPQVAVTAQAEMDAYVRKQNSLVIHHSSDDRVVALIEILSPGNKAKRHSYRAFLEKALSALAQDINLLAIDLLPPTKRDPHGLPGAIWAEIEDEEYRQPADKPLTLAAYVSGSPVRAFVQPIAVGDVLPEMALFLDAANYVKTPLESTYQAAWAGMPRRWREVLDKS
jgi:hypothetical protein